MGPAILDIDPRKQVAQWSKVRRANVSEADWLQVIPVTTGDLFAAMHELRRHGTCDLILIDTPGSAGLPSELAMRARRSNARRRASDDARLARCIQRTAPTQPPRQTTRSDLDSNPHHVAPSECCESAVREGSREDDATFALPGRPPGCDG